MDVPSIMKYPASQEVKYSPYNGECDRYCKLKNDRSGEIRNGFFCQRIMFVCEIVTCFQGMSPKMSVPFYEDVLNFTDLSGIIGTT